MTLPVNYQQQQMPSHSGITINISNPVMNPPGYCSYPQQGYQMAQPQVSYQAPIYPEVVPQNSYNPQTSNNPIEPQYQNASYPPQYYMNNYNYINTPNNNGNKPISVDPLNNIQSDSAMDQKPETVTRTASEPVGQEIALEKPEEQIQDSDLSVSKEIISNIDAQKAEQAEAAKNEKKVKIVALTNEYIMSLEDYLNNPNNEIRYTAAKEILTRLDEDRSRFNDAALNALLNKMLQDPDKSIRVAAMSAFSSGLASGNDFTTKLLKDMQNNPNADKDDVVAAADILLKMAASTEYKYVPINSENVDPQQPITQ